MNRVIVLVLCLASAGAIGLYAMYRGGDTGEPIYTVPARTSDPAPRAATATPPKLIDPEDRVALTRALQRELKRVGCYGGEITGVWTTSSRMAMKAFVERVNAALPIDTPDAVLLSLVQGRQERACGVACPEGQTAAGAGACVPNAVLAKAARGPADAKAEADKTPDKTAAGNAVVGGAALTATAPATLPKGDQAARASDGARSVAGEDGEPLPPEGMRDRRPRRTDAPRPPKVVRDVLGAFGIRF
jgi:hypothetical protein